jgi:hypothetical protein
MFSQSLQVIWLGGRKFRSDAHVFVQQRFGKDLCYCFPFKALYPAAASVRTCIIPGATCSRSVDLIVLVYIPQTIDVKMGVFCRPWVAWRSQSPTRCPAEPGANPKTRRYEKKTHIWMMSSMSWSNWWFLSYKEVKSWDSTTCFRIWQYQTSAWRRYLQMHLLDDQFVFSYWLLELYERGSQNLSHSTDLIASNQQYGELVRQQFFSVITSLVCGIESADLHAWSPLGCWDEERRISPRNPAASDVLAAGLREKLPYALYSFGALGWALLQMESFV